MIYINQRWIHWNENVIILTKFSSLTALEVVILTTSSAISDENVIKMTTSPFQWFRHGWVITSHGSTWIWSKSTVIIPPFPCHSFGPVHDFANNIIILIWIKAEFQIVAWPVPDIKRAQVTCGIIEWREYYTKQEGNKTCFWKTKTVSW